MTNMCFLVFFYPYTFVHCTSLTHVHILGVQWTCMYRFFFILRYLICICLKSSIVFYVFFSASRPARLYYCGLAGSFVLQFLNGTVQACNNALSAFNQKKANDKQSTAPVSGNEDSEELQFLLDFLACHLPLIKIWFDWLCCQPRLWYDCSQQINDATQ